MEEKTNIELAREVGGTAYTNRHIDGSAFAFGPEALDRYTALVEARLITKLLEGAGEPAAWTDQDFMGIYVSEDIANEECQNMAIALHTPDQIAAAVLQREKENMKSYLKLAEVNKQQAAIISDLREEVTAWRNRGTK